MNRHSTEYLDKLSIERITPARAIRMKCGECQGGERGELPLGGIAKAVEECGSTCCPIWPFRMGRDPWRQGPTEEQRAKSRELALRNFARTDPDRVGSASGDDVGDLATK